MPMPLQKIKEYMYDMDVVEAYIDIYSEDNIMDLGILDRRPFYKFSTVILPNRNCVVFSDWNPNNNNDVIKGAVYSNRKQLCTLHYTQSTRS